MVLLPSVLVTPNPVVVFPCGSESIKRTRRSLAANEAAKLMAVVVFPTPPFWFAIAMTLPKRPKHSIAWFHVERVERHKRTISPITTPTERKKLSSARPALKTTVLLIRDLAWKVIANDVSRETSINANPIVAPGKRNLPVQNKARTIRRVSLADHQSKTTGQFWRHLQHRSRINRPRYHPIEAPSQFLGTFRAHGHIPQLTRSLPQKHGLPLMRLRQRNLQFGPQYCHRDPRKARARAKIQNLRRPNRQMIGEE